MSLFILVIGIIAFFIIKYAQTGYWISKGFVPLSLGLMYIGFMIKTLSFDDSSPMNNLMQFMDEKGFFYNFWGFLACITFWVTFLYQIFFFLTHIIGFEDIREDIKWYATFYWPIYASIYASFFTAIAFPSDLFSLLILSITFFILSVGQFHLSHFFSGMSLSCLFYKYAAGQTFEILGLFRTFYEILKSFFPDSIGLLTLAALVAHIYEEIIRNK